MKKKRQYELGSLFRVSRPNYVIIFKHGLVHLQVRARDEEYHSPWLVSGTSNRRESQFRR